MPSRPPRKSRTIDTSNERQHRPPQDEPNPVKPTQRHRGDSGGVATRILGHVAATGRRVQGKRDARSHGA